MSLYNGLGRGMSVFGGAEENLVDKYKMYKLSAEADAKRQMVKKLCEVFKGLKFDVPDFPTSDDPVELEQCADQLKEVVAKRLKRGLKEDEASREKVCRLLAREINNIFGGQLIDTSLGVESVCASVTEFCLSFARGLHLEYFTVQADVKKSITNCELLIEVMNKLSKEMDSLMADTKDGAVISKYSTIRSVYSRAGAELTKQMHVLENLMNVKTMDDPLKAAFKEGSDLRSIVESLGVKTSDFRTGKYADNIVQILLGLTTVAEAAARVHSALKKVGMTAEEYRNTPTMEDLKKKLSDLGIKQTDNFAIFARASEILEKNFDPNSADWKAVTGAAELRYGLNAERYDEFGNPNFTESGEKISSMAKQLLKREAEQKAVVEIFSKDLVPIYAKLIRALSDITPKLGKEIKIDKQTNLIRSQLKNLVKSTENKKRAELSLIGVFVDVKAREIREQYILAINGLIQACKDVNGFSGLVAAAEDVKKLIEHFYDIGKAKFGGDEKTGGADLVSALPAITRTSEQMTKSINEFIYHYFLAQMQHNFEFTHEQIESQSDEYVKLLGAAVANRIAEVKTAYKPKIESAAVLGNFHNGSGDNNPHVNGGRANTFHANGANNKPQLDCYTKMANKRITVLENFYAAIQAVDLYLKEFTIEITKNSDKVLELKQMIEETEMINNWFNDSTGDSICDYFIFDYSNAVIPAGGRKLNTKLNEHYYKTITDADGLNNGDLNTTFTVVPYVDGGNLSVNGDNIIDGDKSKDVKHPILDKIFDNFSGFKNLISIFAKIGDIGNKKVFMSPMQIFTALQEFIKESSLEYCKLTGPGPIYPLGYTPTIINRTLSGSFGSLDLNKEQTYLKLAIQAMIGKVFTTIGLHDVLTNITPIGTITDTRLILGGSLENVECITEASELYFRLPRLAEFYREILKFTKADNADVKIALIPDLGTVFGPFIKFIFRIDGESANVAVAVDKYSDQELRIIISEINKIYLHYKSTTTALEEFVKEINKRYGLIKKDDIDKYYDLIDTLNRTNGADVNISDSETDYKLFRDEDSKFTGKAPSDMFYVGDSKKAELKDERVLNDNHNVRLNAFRDEIKKVFGNLKSENLELTYDIFIEQCEQKLKTTEDRDERMKIVYKLIQNATHVTTNISKVQLFQETVVNGLETLANINNVLDNFIRIAYRLDLVRKMQTAIILNSAANPGSYNIAGNTPIIVHNNPSIAVNNALPPIAAVLVEPKMKDVDEAIALMGSTYADDVIAFYDNTYQIYSEISLIKAETVNTPLPGRDRINLTGTAGIGGAMLPDADAKIVTTAPPAGPQRSYMAALTLMTNYEAALQELLESTFNIISTKLITVSYNSDKTASFNYTKLRNVIDETFVSVKKYIELFKPYIAESILDKFIKNDKLQPYSLYSLEEKLIYNKFENDKKENIYHFDKSVKAYNRVLIWLMESKPDVAKGFTCTVGNADFANLAGRVTASIDAIVVTGGASRPYVPYPYAQVFKRLLYKFSRPNFVDAAANAAIKTFTSADSSDYTFYLKSSNPDGSVDNPTAAQGGDDTLPTKIEYTRAAYIDSSNMITNSSILHMFNQLIERFIATNSDMSPSLKIYSNLINTLYAGQLSKVINNPKSGLPDTYRSVGQLSIDAAGAANPNTLHAALSANTDITVASDTVNNAVPILTAGRAATPHADLNMNNLLEDYNGPADEENILVYSLARLLQVISKRVLKNTSIPAHLITSLTDVSPYVKEQMRCNLPYFKKWFELLSLKCDYLLDFIENVNPSLANYMCKNNAANAQSLYALQADLNDNGNMRDYTTAADSVYAKLYKHSSMSDPTIAIRQYKSDNDDAYVKKLLRKLSGVCFSLVDTCDSVLKELGDSPVYGQIDEASIEMHVRRYKSLPISPYTFYHAMVKNNTYFSTIGGESFKERYFTRYLINNEKLSLESMPYEKQILKEYNEISLDSEKISEDQFIQYLSNINNMMNLCLNININRNLITVYKKTALNAVPGADIKKDAYYTAVKAELDNNQMNQMYSSALANINSDAIVNAVDGYPAIVTLQAAPAAVVTNKRQMVYRLSPITDFVEKSDNIKYLELVSGEYSGGKTPADRRQERINNIVDMNIIPFNIHMLMRDIPLINTYNYAATFVDFIKSYTQYKNDSPATKKLFVELLEDPYVDLANKREALEGIFVGDDSLGMGRPKFLSDQLWNKVLFKDVYGNTRYVSEERSIINREDYNTGHDYLIRFVAVMRSHGWDLSLFQVPQAVNDFYTHTLTKAVTKAELNAFDNLFDTTDQATKNTSINTIFGAQLTETIELMNDAVVNFVASLERQTAGGVVPAGLGNLEVATFNGARAATAGTNLRGDLAAFTGAYTAATFDPIVQRINAINDAMLNGALKDATITSNMFNVAMNGGDRTKGDGAGGGAGRPANYARYATVQVAVDVFLTQLKKLRTLLVLGQTYYKSGTAVVDSANVRVPTAGVGFGGGNTNAETNDMFAIVDKYIKKLKTKLDAVNPPLANNTNISTHSAGDQAYKRISPNSLTYIDKDNTIQTVNITAAKLAILDNCSNYRLDTYLIRNLMFITNINRLLRQVFEKELTGSREVIKHGYELANAGLTEYGQYPMKPNEIFYSRQVNNLSRLTRDANSAEFYNS